MAIIGIDENGRFHQPLPPQSDKIDNDACYADETAIARAYPLSPHLYVRIPV